MDPELIALLGAGIGASAGIAGALIGGRFQVALEREKWLREKEDGYAAELRSAVKELTSQLATAIHSMSWLTWLAKESPNKIEQENLDAYDLEMHRVLPGIMSSHALLAGMDREVHRQLEETVAFTYALDARIGRAALDVVPGDPATAAGLASLYQESVDFHDRLIKIVPDVLEPYAATKKT